jgi:hypothetical protein
MASESTWTPIATYTVTADNSQQDIGFGTLPTGYTDLEMVCHFRTQNPNPGGLTALYFSVDSSVTNRSYTWATSDGTTGSSGRASNTNYVQPAPAGTTPYNGTTANVFATFRMSLLNYTNTNGFKPFVIRYAGDTGGAGSTTITAGQIRSTSAVTAINFATYGQSYFKTGTTISLYGIKAA